MNHLPYDAMMHLRLLNDHSRLQVSVKLLKRELIQTITTLSGFIYQKNVKIDGTYPNDPHLKGRLRSNHLVKDFRVW